MWLFYSWLVVRIYYHRKLGESPNPFARAQVELLILQDSEDHTSYFEAKTCSTGFGDIVYVSLGELLCVVIKGATCYSVVFVLPLWKSRNCVSFQVEGTMSPPHA